MVLIQLIDGNRRNTRRCHTVEIQRKHSIIFLHCYTASISMLFNNCWSFERRMAKISLIRSVLRCTTASTMTEQSSGLYLSTTRHPQSKMSSTRGLPLEPYLWCQHSSVNSSPGRCRCRAVSSWPALPARRPPLVSPVAADIKISLLVLDQVYLVSAMNCCFRIQARPQGAGGRAGRRQEQSSCTQHNMNIIEV